MRMPEVNYLAVFVAGLVIFLLGGLWYSPILFAKRWIALQGRTEEQMRADAAASNMPVMYLIAFICALIIAWAMAVLTKPVVPEAAGPTSTWIVRGVRPGAVKVLGVAIATS